MPHAAKPKSIGVGAPIAFVWLWWTPALGFSQGHDADLVCRGVRVALEAHCSGRANPAYPSCQSERLSFINMKTGKAKTVPGAGALIRGGEGGKGQAKILDGLASGWTCVRGSKSWYIVVRYDNGGNCKHCEWHEIYTLQGKWLTRGARTNPHAFAKVYRSLGLPKPLDPPPVDIAWGS
jgi:hypothetical protein